MTTTSKLPIFIDTNVLIRANVATAPTHEEALECLKRLGKSSAELWVSQQILREYLANVTRQQTFMSPIPMATAIARIEYFQSHFIVAQDSERVFANLLKLLNSTTTSGKQIHDTNIAATMQTYGITQLLTYNPTDFTRFSAYITVLSPEDLLKNMEE
jgi:predicted nucleic acid-binding protein